MPEFARLVTFILACLVLLIIPGPAVFYIVTRSIDQGRKAGIVSVLGIALGTFVHVGAAAFGISAILMTSATAFSVVKYLGAGYLVYLGVRRICAGHGFEPRRGNNRTRLRTVFWQGVVVNILNPKTAMFFFAFLPQFVDPSRGTVWAQSLMLGSLFVLLGVFSDGIYALMAGQVNHVLSERWSTFGSAGRYVSGGTYVALGVAAAVSGNHK